MDLSDDQSGAPLEAPAPPPAGPESDPSTTTQAGLSMLDDAARSPDPAVCPFFRYELDGDLVAPLHIADDGNRCIAIGGPRPQSTRQQELVCLRAAHADCPRYLRGAMALREPLAARPSAAVPRATVAALLVLVLSAGISFGFVVQRGGIDLPVVPGSPPSTAIALAPLSSDAPTASPTLAASAAPESSVSALDPASPSASVAPPSAPPSVDASPLSAPSPTPAPTVAPASPVVSPAPTPAPTPKPTKKPTSNRYALLTPCPGRNRCFIYTVRSGDNLFSIAHYFGVPLATIYAWNPAYANGAHLRKGDQIRMPPPTR